MDLEDGRFFGSAFVQLFVSESKVMGGCWVLIIGTIPYFTNYRLGSGVLLSVFLGMH